jgi:hypothetical protein
MGGMLSQSFFCSVSNRYHFRRRARRTLFGERLESRALLASLAHNSFFPCDVNGDGQLAPIDVLVLVNQLGDTTISGTTDDAPEAEQPLWFDVDNNGSLTPADPLIAVNQLNSLLAAPTLPVPLVGGLAPESDPNGNGVVLGGDIVIQGQSPPFAAVRLTVGNQASQQAMADENGRFSFSVHVEPGAHPVRLEATDQLRPVVAVERTLKRSDVALDWNATLLQVIRDWTTLSNDPYTNRVVTERPPVAARNLAMVHAAMYDAVVGIEGGFTPYLVTSQAPAGASSIAAAAAAAHRVASAVYTQPHELAVFDASLAESLATVPDGTAKDVGIAWGREVGDAMLAQRANDGANTMVSYSPGSDPGDWNRTFPDFLPPLIPQWPQVEPFALSSGSQFRPAAPPSLDSADYAAAVDEVLRLGRYDSTERTAEQTEIALYWADGGGTYTPPGHWNQIAADVSISQSQTLLENARTFALLNIALADAGIASWDSKYAYDLWRPIDAIRRGGSDGNEATVEIASWIPLLKTPPFPTYTSGHSTFSGAAATVLTSLFGDDVAFSSESDGHAGFRLRPLAVNQVVTRHFTSFWDAAEEAGLSRIYGGIHFQFDNSAGLATGQAVGQYVVDQLLRAET